MILDHKKSLRFSGAVLDFLSEDLSTPAHENSLIRAQHDGFTLDGCVQSGSRFEVWRGVDKHGLEVVIKYPTGSSSVRERSALQLQDEYAALASVQCDGVSKAVAHVSGTDGYLATVFEGDQDLSEWIKSACPNQRKLLETVSRCVSALSALHESGLIHGDLKPQHFVIRDDGTPVIIDLGLSERWRDIDRHVQLSHRIGGTSHYVPPEVRNRSVDRPNPCQDVYAFGMILKEAFNTANLSPGRFASIIRTATSPDPNMRYRDAHALLHAIQQAQLSNRRPYWIMAAILMIVLPLVILWAANAPKRVQLSDTPDTRPHGENPYGDLVPVRLPRYHQASGILAWSCPEGYLGSRQIGTGDINKAIIDSGIRDIDIAPGMVAIVRDDGVLSIYTPELKLISTIKFDSPIQRARFGHAADYLHCWLPEQDRFVTARTDGTVLGSLAIEAEYILWDINDPDHAIATRGGGIALVDFDAGTISESSSPTVAAITSADYDPSTGGLMLGSADGYAHLFDEGEWEHINLRTNNPVTAVHVSGFSGVAGEVLALDWDTKGIVGRYGSPAPGVLEMQLIVEEGTVTSVSSTGVGSWAIER